jgi:hypothetical protein
MSCHYSTLNSMPCRKPCNRYTSVDSVYEGAVPVKLEGYGYEPTTESFEGAYEPTIAREGYSYEPTVEGYGNGQKIVQKKRMNKHINTVHSCNCNCAPKMMMKERFENNMEGNCGCEPMNKNYRMAECDYNRSPTWNYHRAEMPMLQPVREGLEMGMENACGCAMNNPPYKIPDCGQYNQSPTWMDQASFRENIQNQY